MMRKLVTVFMLVLLFGACRSNAIEISVQFDSVSGLAPNDRVLFERNEAGCVETIHYTADGQYRVRLSVSEGFANAVTEYSAFFIVDDYGRTGRKAIEIRLTRMGGNPLADGTVVKGVDPSEDFAERLEKDIEEGVSFLKDQLQRFSRDIQQIPESEEYQRLKQSLKELANEISRSEEQTRKRLKEQWLPQIEKELDKLKERLREMGRDQEIQTLQEDLDRIHRI